MSKKKVVRQRYTDELKERARKLGIGHALKQAACFNERRHQLRVPSKTGWCRMTQRWWAVDVWLVHVAALAVLVVLLARYA